MGLQLKGCVLLRIVIHDVLMAIRATAGDFEAFIFFPRRIETFCELCTPNFSAELKLHERMQVGGIQ